MPEHIKYEREGYLYGDLPDEPGGIAHIDTLYIYPDCRGRGVGTYLLTCFVGRCIEKGARKIEAEFKPHSDADPNKVMEFYRRHGFEFYYEEDKTFAYRDLT